MIRWGVGVGDRSRVVTRPLALEATTASCIEHSLNLAVLGLPLLSLIEARAPVVCFILLHFGSDKAAGDERLFGELVTKYRAYRNVGIHWRFCMVHGGQHIAEDPFEKDGLINRCHQWSKLFRDQDYIDNWAVGCSKALATIDIVEPSSAQAVALARASSDQIIDIVAKYSIYKHGDNTAVPARESLEPLVAELKRFLHIPKRNFRMRRHLCNFASCDLCPCRSKSSAIFEVTTAFMRLFIPLIPT